MTPSKHAEALVQKFEGFCSKSYRCPAGVLTIGYGHTRGVKQGDVCSKEQALLFLREDLQSAANTVDFLVTVPLTQGQYDALCCFIFNIGAKKFRGSTLLRKLNNQDYKGAADEFLRWTKAGGRELSGLVKRRKAERSLFLSD